MAVYDSGAAEIEIGGKNKQAHKIRQRQSELEIEGCWKTER